MEDGILYIQYKAEALYLYVDQFDHAINYPDFADISLRFSTEGEQLIITAIFNNLQTLDKELIRKHTKHAACEMCELFSIFFGQNISYPISNKDNLHTLDIPEQRQTYREGNVIYAHTPESIAMSISVSGKLITCLTDNNRDNLVKFLSGNGLNKNYLWHEYYSALACPDSVGRFMLLYNLLLQIIGDKKEQKDLDQEILRIDSSVPTSIKPARSDDDKKHRQKQRPEKTVVETIFTRIRNEIGHLRGTKIDQIKKDAASQTGRLAVIVKILINEKIDARERCPA